MMTAVVITIVWIVIAFAVVRFMQRTSRRRDRLDALARTPATETHQPYRTPVLGQHQAN